MSYSLLDLVEIWQIFIAKRLELLNTHHCAVCTMVFKWEKAQKLFFGRMFELYLYVMPKIGNIYIRDQFTELLIHVLAMNYDKIAVTLQHSNSGRRP